MEQILCDATKKPREEVICHLYDMAQVPLNKLKDIDFGNNYSWTTQLFPGTYYKLKVRVDASRYKNREAGTVTGNAVIYPLLDEKDNTSYTEQDIAAFQIEEILLKDEGDE